MYTESYITGSKSTTRKHNGANTPETASEIAKGGTVGVKSAIMQDYERWKAKKDAGVSKAELTRRAKRVTDNDVDDDELFRATRAREEADALRAAAEEVASLDSSEVCVVIHPPFNSLFVMLIRLFSLITDTNTTFEYDP